MGRRALPKFDTTLDLTRHLLTPEQLPEPWDAAALFGRAAPLEIEVGSGKGLFLSSAAQRTPEHDYLGVEVAFKYARHAAARLAKRAIPNAKMVHGDALAMFRTQVPTASLHAVHVYFPDPWWKARHRKRRVMNETFVKDVERTLVAGGKLHFWTDVEEYFQTALETLKEHSTLAGPFAVEEQMAEHDLDYRTHFERRMRLHQLPVYRSEFVKQA